MREDILPVLLPQGNLIDPRELAEAIANALYPTDPLYLKGVKCIVGKLSKIKGKVDVEYIDEVNKFEYNANENGEYCFSLPFVITNAEMQSLEEILSQLPELEYPVTDRARDEVFNALKDHPLWKDSTPIFIDEAAIERRKTDHKECEKMHLRALVRAVEEKTITCCSANHVPMTSMGIGAFISRKAAQIYLESASLSICNDKSEISNSKKIDADLCLSEVARKINWKKEKFVSEKLKVLCSASELWLQMPYDEYLDKIDYLNFHKEKISKLLKCPEFAGRTKLRDRAAEYIRPLYARRMSYEGIRGSQLYREPRSPELTALLLASRLWDGWEKNGKTPPPTKLAITEAIKQALPECYQADIGFLAEGPKIIQLEAADTGRENQSKTMKARKPARRV